MAENGSLTKRSKTKIIGLFGIILLLVGGLSAGWYWAAGKLDGTVTQFARTMGEGGKLLTCEGQDVSGYPFRIGVNCRSLIFEDPANGVSLSGGALRTAAQLYRPGHVLAELDAPLDLVVPGLAPLTLNWRNLRASSNVSTSGPERISLVADQLDISANDFGERDLLARVQEMQFHGRKGADDPHSLDLALSASDWLIDDDGAGVVEPVDVSIAANLKEAFAALRSGVDIPSLLKIQGGEGELSDFTITTRDGGRLSVSGPLQINPQGRVSGQLTINVDDPVKLVSYVSSVFPPAGEALSNVSQYLQAFEKKEGEKAVIRNFKVTLKEDRILVGFIEVGKLPRLF